MKSFSTVIIFFVAFGLAGCGTPNHLERTTNNLKPLLAAGKYDVAIALSRNDIAYDSAVGDALRKELAAYPEVSTAYKSRIQAELGGRSDSASLESIAQSIRLAQRDGVLKEADANELTQELAKQIEIIARTLHVPSHVWAELTQEQRQALQAKYIADSILANSYGTIVDAQSLNESTSGSNAGSELGSAFGQAAYIDSAFKGNTWNYSAKNQLAAGIVGAVVGSMANTAPRAQFRTRYTIKIGNGNIEYIEEIKSDPFRHTIGLCVALSPIRPIEQTFCTITKEVFLLKYLPPETRLASGGQPVVESGDQRISPARPPALITLADRVNTQQAAPPRAELTVSDIAWNEGSSIVGYVAPSSSATISQQIERGTAFQVQVVLKDWARVRLGTGSVVWVETRHLTWANSKQ